MKKRGVLLIGMPGAGKTTIGRELSKVLKMNFLDMDEFIERSTGKEIKELFAQGEEVFRDLESKSCELLSTLKNVVISSGGGIVTREENMGNFKESRNGQMVFNFGGNNENNKDSDSRHTGYQGI